MATIKELKANGGNGSSDNEGAGRPTNESKGEATSEKTIANKESQQ